MALRAPCRSSEADAEYERADARFREATRQYWEIAESRDMSRDEHYRILGQATDEALARMSG
jgi:hypothetical protein